MDLKVSYPCKRDQIMFLNYIRPFLKKKKKILMGSQKQNVTCPIICYQKKNQKWLQRWVKKLFKP